MKAFATLLYSDDYLDGALVLGQSLKEHHPEIARIVLVTSSVSKDAINQLGAVFDKLVPVAPIKSPSAACPKHLEHVFTKLHVFGLTQYESIVFLDADTFVVKPIDKLFDFAKPKHIAAAPDAGWPDIFNSGVFAIVPDAEQHSKLVEDVTTTASFDTGDQGYLNEQFSESWTRVPFVYNVTPTTAYQFPTAATRFSKEISVLHFAGWVKPWETETPPNELTDVYNQWWSIYNENFAGSTSKGKIIQPDPLWWDASKRPPPISSVAQAGNFQFVSADNSWDAASQSTPHMELGVSTVHFPFEAKSPAAERYFPEDS